MSDKSIQLHIRLSEEEYQIIKENAAASEKTISAYMRAMSLNMCIFKPDYSCVSEHTHQLSVIKNAIIQLTFTIIKSGKYVPPDLEYIYDKLAEIFKTEAKFLTEYEKSNKQAQKIIEKTVKNLVNECLCTKGQDT